MHPHVHKINAPIIYNFQNSKIFTVEPNYQTNFPICYKLTQVKFYFFEFFWS